MQTTITDFLLSLFIVYKFYSKGINTVFMPFNKKVFHVFLTLRKLQLFHIPWDHELQWRALIFFLFSLRLLLMCCKVSFICNWNHTCHNITCVFGPFLEILPCALAVSLMLWIVHYIYYNYALHDCLFMCFLIAILFSKE